MKLNKFLSLFSNCKPLYSNLIIFILLMIGAALRIKYDNYENYKKPLLTIISLFCFHFLIVLFFCKKKFIKIAYFISLLPFILIFIQSIFILSETYEIFKNIKNDIENKTMLNNYDNQAQS